jgi:excisionase family DNA binding protein
MDSVEKLEDLKWLADLLKLRKSKTHQLVADGTIPSVLLLNGRRRTFRVRPSEVAKWLREREVCR